MKKKKNDKIKNAVDKQNNKFRDIHTLHKQFKHEGSKTLVQDLYTPSPKNNE